MGLFDVDFNKAVFENIPVDERTAARYSWLKVLIKPVKVLYNDFMTFRANVLYNLAHNSQVCYMEAMLNDAFDNVDRGIYITDGTDYEPLYIYMDSEMKPVYLDTIAEIGTGIIPEPDPVRLYTNGEINSVSGDFIVNVPVALVFDTARMIALIDNYKLPSKNYAIVTF